jgi:hypothetical protein
MKRNTKYNGLKERPHFGSIVDYLENEHPKTTYPFDRTATILRNSPYFTQLDGENGMDLQEFENRLEKDKLRTILLREQASATGLTVPEAKATTKASQTETTPIAYDLKGGDESEEEMIEAASSREYERRDAMPDLVAAEGLPDITRVEELMTPEQRRDNLRQRVEERKASASSSSPTQSVPIRSSQPAIPKTPPKTPTQPTPKTPTQSIPKTSPQPPPPKTPPKTPPQRGRPKSKGPAASRAKPTPPSPL